MTQAPSLWEPYTVEVPDARIYTGSLVGDLSPLLTAPFHDRPDAEHPARSGVL
jgi:hypothetical protein